MTMKTVADVFLLMVYLGAGDSRTLVSDNMYFWSIVDCNYYASQVSKRYGSYGYADYMHEKDRVTAYCIPKRVNPDDVKVY